MSYLNPFTFSNMDTLMIESYKNIVDNKGKKSMGRVSPKGF